MKKVLSLVLCAVMAMALLAACGGDASSTAADSVSESEAAVSSLPESEPEQSGDGADMRIAGLKGPTTMGMVALMNDVDNGEARHSYEVEMYGTADEVVPLLVSGQIDAAAVPANLASVLWNNTDGAVQVAAINTLGVLYVVENGESVNSIEDLRGKTVYSTGKGTTPEFALNYILEQNGMDPATDLTIEYKSESTEIAALMAEGEDVIAVLPQPYVTAVQMQNEDVRVALSLTEEWDKVSTDSSLVTGVLLVRTEFLKENQSLFWEFLEDYEASINWVNDNTEDAAELVAQYGIVEKAPVAAQALPNCNIVYIAGDDLRPALEGYLQVLYDQNPEAVGGEMPGDNFYYVGQ